MTQRRTRSRDRLQVRNGERSVECEWCGRPYAPEQVEWVHDDWVTSDLHRGYVIASLCGECKCLALDRCWHCGRLTGRSDGLCSNCASEVGP